MTEEQKLRVQELTAEIDSLVPRTEAVVVMRAYGGGCDESEMTATEAGYLRFGIELLKVSFLPPLADAKTAQVDVDLEYLVAERSDVHFHMFHLDNRLMPDEPPSNQTKQNWKNNALTVTCGFLFILLVYVVAVGVITIGSWLSKL